MDDEELGLPPEVTKETFLAAVKADEEAEIATRKADLAQRDWNQAHPGDYNLRHSFLVIEADAVARSARETLLYQARQYAKSLT